MDKQSELKRIEDHLALLAEHFDSVQIFVTKHEPTMHDGTLHISKGIGNWFARYGQIKAWVVREDSCEGENGRQMADPTED